MTRFTPVHVCYCQFQVLGSADGDGSLGLHVVGDELLQVTGASQLTGLTGLHTGQVEVGVAVLSAPPADLADGWDAATETTLWCPDGRITVCGLMSDPPDALHDITVGGAGLYRVRVHARERRRESYQIEAERRPVEQYQVNVWPVDADVGLKTLRLDDLPPMGVRPDPARAAGWAMQRLVALANPDPRLVALRELAERMGRADPPEAPAAVARVAVQRTRWMPAGRAQQVLDHLGESFGAHADGDELVWPAGDVEIRLRVLAPGAGVPAPPATPHGMTGEWRWVPRPGSAIAVPDLQASTVEIHAVPNPARGAADLVVVHRGVRAQDAVLLGLIWDYLLDRAGTATVDGAVPPLPWEPLFAAARPVHPARVARARRAAPQAIAAPVLAAGIVVVAGFEARQGDAPPLDDRLRGLAANVLGLSRIDRELLDALTLAPPDVQRAIARWAARQACTTAGLAGIDWIAGALLALDRGEPLPAPFDDDHAAWQRLQADSRVPRTTVTTPEGIENCSQQALALPAIRAAAHADPLAAAVDTVYFATLASGQQHRSLLAAARAELNHHG